MGLKGYKEIKKTKIKKKTLFHIFLLKKENLQ